MLSKEQDKKLRALIKELKLLEQEKLDKINQLERAIMQNGKE